MENWTNRLPRDYLLHRLLKEGPDSIVAVVRRRGAHDRLVIKLFSGEAPERNRHRFSEEIRLRSEHPHPGIARIVDFGPTRDGGLYAVTPFIRRTNPIRWVRENRLERFPIYIRRLVEPLAFLHERGIVHGDLKPDNILFQAKGSEIGHLLLTDFLPPLFPKKEEFGLLVGTVAYLAPEGILGEGIDHRADLYALGVTLYEILTGRLPFRGSAVEIARNHLGTQPDLSFLSDRSLPGEWIDGMERLLQKNPADRPQSTGELLRFFFGKQTRIRKVNVPAMPPFVGRNNLREKFADWFDRDEGSCFVVRGEEGSGRTRFLQRVASELRLRENLVVAVPSLRGGSSEPFEGIRRLFGAIRSGSSGVDLARLVPKGGDRGGEFAQDRGGEVALFRGLRSAFTRELRALAGKSGKPVLVVMDDLDLLDLSSLRFIRFLIDREKRDPARYLFSLVEAAPDGSSGFVRMLADRNLAVMVTLKPFRAEEVETWIGGVLGDGKITPTLLNESIRLSRGLPRELDTIFKDWAARDLIRKKFGRFSLRRGVKWERTGPVESIPASVLRDLSPLSKRIAAGVAISPVARGSRFLQRLLMISEEDWLREGMLLVRHGVLRIENRNEADLFSPAREEFRKSLTALVPEKTRTQLHRQAVRLVEEEGRKGEEGTAALCAHHLEGAGFRLKALRKYMEAAAKLEKLFQYHEAGDLYERALSLGRRSLTPMERGNLLGRLAEARYGAGEQREALHSIGLLRRALKDEPKGRIVAYRFERLRAWIHFLLGETTKAVLQLDALRKSEDSVPPGERASVLMDLSWVVMIQGDPDSAVGHLEKALKILRGTREKTLRGRILNRMGAVAYYRSDWKSAGSFLKRSIRTLEGTGQGDVVAPLSNLALVHVWNGELSRAQVVLERALDIAERTGDVLEEARIAEDLARIHFRRGDWKKADRFLTRVETTYREFADESRSIQARLSRGQMMRERGHLGGSLRCLERALEEARREGSPHTLFTALNLTALTRIARGEAGEAGTLLEEAEEILGAHLEGRYEGFFYRTRARFHLLQERYGEAESDLGSAVRVFRKGEEELMLLESCLLQARVRIEWGKGPSPEPPLRAAAALFGEEMPLLEARRVFLEGRRAEQKGDLREAAEKFRSAGAIERKIGARLDLAESLAWAGSVHSRLDEPRKAKRFLAEADDLFRQIRFATPPPFLRNVLSRLSVRTDGPDESFHVICRISEAINSLHKVDAILERVLDQAVDYLGADRGLILLHSEEGSLIPRMARSLDGATLESVVKFSRTLFREAQEAEEPFVMENALSDTRFGSAESVQTYNILSVICTPLRSKGASIGVIYLDNCRRSGVFTQSDIEFIRALADLTGIAIENARLMEDLHEENTLLRQEIHRRSERPSIIARSRGMKQVLDQIETAAKAEITVLLLGETGVGKELAAHRIHTRSRRREKPFLRINCSALAPTLIEDELFGHEPGAFTDARESKAGIFERANGGTLLLDEIGDMPLSAQAKILRVLQDGEFLRLGGTRTIRSDVRLVAATNRDLEEMVHKGEFRLDLYYRLNGFSVRIPPLRERTEDIPVLAGHFLRNHSQRNDKRIASIDRHALAILRAHSWPGNVRELDHVIERAVILCEERVIRLDHLPVDLRRDLPVSVGDVDRRREGGEIDLAHELQRVERDTILRALIQADWNRTEAAKLLGIHESTVRKKIRLFRLEDFRTRSS